MERAVADPAKLTKPDLKDVCVDIGLKVGGNKPELVVRILESLELEMACATAPLSLLVEARRQKTARWRGDNSCLVRFAFAFDRSASSVAPTSVWRFRRFMHDRYYGDEDRLQRLSVGACIECGDRQTPVDPRCAAFSCASCCPKNGCTVHRAPIVQAVGNNRRTTMAACCVRAPCTNPVSASCNAAMCGLCCPKNGCARHGR